MAALAGMREERARGARALTGAGEREMKAERGGVP